MLALIEVSFVDCSRDGGSGKSRKLIDCLVDYCRMAQLLYSLGFDEDEGRDVNTKMGK